MIQENHCSIGPHRFLERMRQVANQKNRPEFSSFDQNDSVEYFAFLIDCMHNSLNQLDPNVKCPRSTYSFINEYLDQVETKDSSILQKLFVSCSINQYIHPVTQQKEFSKLEHEFILALSIPESRTVSLYDCFVDTFKEELMSGDNAWFDEKDQIKKTVVKRSALCYTPPILILPSFLSQHRLDSAC
jgi:ubiquitin C-terminal hydrolase